MTWTTILVLVVLAVYTLGSWLVEAYRVGKLRMLLRRMEWGCANREDQTYCLVCYNEEKQGHTPSCELAAALKNVQSL